MTVHAAYSGDTLHVKIVRDKNSETGLLVPYCSPVELRRDKLLTHQFHSAFCIWTMFWQDFLSEVSVLSFTVQWNLLSICSLTFLNNLLHYFVFKLHGKFLYGAYSLRETLIVVWVFRKWQCKTINMYDVFFWCAI